MSLPDFDTLFREADAAARRIPVAAIGAADRTVLLAVTEAGRRGWIAPILVGSAEAIRATAAECGADLADLAGCRIVDSSEPATAGVEEVRAGRAVMLMKGQIATPELIRAVLQPAAGLRTGRTLCQVVLMEVTVPNDGALRRFLLADTGLCIRPTLDQKIDILRSLLETARGLGLSEPRVAVMSASEKATPAMPDTLEAEELQRRGAAGEFGGGTVQGPLSFDLAFAADAGEKKRIAGEVVGEADAMLFPDLLSANLTVKAIMYTANCRFGGVVRGAGCPIVFMSRADTTETRLNSLAYALRLV